MYQFSTHYPLARSKEYFDTIKQVVRHLKKCVKTTNEWRKSNEQLPLKTTDLEHALKLLKIDMDENLNAMKYLGPPSEICTENLEPSVHLKETEK